MIHFVVPAQKSGGVYDFSLRLVGAIGSDKACLVHLSKENRYDWVIEPTDTVMLQLSGYGFAKRGAPLWLLYEIEKRRSCIKTFGIFFHEVYAFGSPWASSFWLSPVQRYISQRLVELADFWATSREGTAEWLKRYAGEKPHAVLPVFSTIGELAVFPDTRSRRIIIFGSPGLRKATYEAAGKSLFTWASQESIEIHDIGSPISDKPLSLELCSKGVILHGRLGPEEASNLMRDSLYGLLSYPSDYVSKSSVFASYCAHGLCPILISKKYFGADSLVSGRHYLPGIATNPDSSLAQSVGLAAWEWYQDHSLRFHAEFIRSTLSLGKVKAK